MTVAESPVGACWELSIVEPCKPHLLSGTDDNSGSGIEGVAAFAGSSEFRFSTRFCGLGCGRCRSNLEPLTAFFGVCWVPKGGGLKIGGSFSQEAESAVTFENCTASRASVASGSPLGNDVFGNPVGNDVGGK